MVWQWVERVFFIQVIRLRENNFLHLAKCTKCLLNEEQNEGREESQSINTLELLFMAAFSLLRCWLSQCNAQLLYANALVRGSPNQQYNTKHNVQIHIVKVEYQLSFKLLNWSMVILFIGFNCIKIIKSCQLLLLVWWVIFYDFMWNTQWASHFLTCQHDVCVLTDLIIIKNIDINLIKLNYNGN